MAQIYLRRGDRLYINDRTFGGFAESTFNDYQLPIRLIQNDKRTTKPKKPFVVFGPTCDSNDRLSQLIELPEDVGEGDWIEFSLLGAYSNALKTNFNGFGSCRFVDIEGV